MIIHLIPLIAQADPLEGTGLSFGWLLVKTLLAMTFIIALAIVFIRYILPRFQVGRTSSSSPIKILARTGLETRKGLYIIQVGKKSALIGTSDHNVTKLMDLEEGDVG